MGLRFGFLAASLHIATIIALTTVPNNAVFRSNIGLDTQRVKIVTDEWGGAGLAATRLIEKGEIIVSVPLEMCLIAGRDGSIRNLVGQSDMVWDALGDLRDPISEEQEKILSWDLRLAFALLEATSGNAKATKFWEQYYATLPKPHTVTVPFCFSERCLVQTQDEDLIQRARAQKQRLASQLLGDFDNPSWHRSGVGCENFHTPPGPLSWAFALVRSRCFQVSEDFFAVTPIIEIANHASTDSANAEFVVYGSSLEEGACLLKAKSKIEPNESILISYDASSEHPYDNRRLFTQYGFTLSPENSDYSLSNNGVNDDVEVDKNENEDFEKSKVIDLLVDAAISLLGPDRPSLPFLNPDVIQKSSQVIGRRIRSLTQGPKASEIFETLLAELLQRETSLQTSLSYDVTLLQKLESSSESLVDEAGDKTSDKSRGMSRLQFSAAVRYRLNNKVNLAVTRLMLNLAQSNLAQSSIIAL